MTREDFEKFSQLIEENLNNVEFADIDIEDKFDKAIKVCFMLLNMCDGFVEIMPDSILDRIKLTQE